MKLELKNLASYLPYGLQIIDHLPKDTKFTMYGSNIDYCINYCKPILRPLSDLTKEIEVNGEKFVPMNILFNCDEFDSIIGHSSIEYANDFIKSNDRLSLCYDFYFWQKLLEWHFDIYGLIENGLAIDINTLNN
jgi:hypothetical protein